MRLNRMTNDATPIPRPDDFAYARMARLLILLDSVPDKPKPKPLDAERISIYDFFSDNPFLLFGPTSRERGSLLVAGFDPSSLSYNSSGQRFANRVARLEHDLASLLARGLILTEVSGARISYRLTQAGSSVLADFSSMYALAFRRSAQMVIGNLNSLSNSALRASVHDMLRATEFLLDLEIGDAEEAAA